MSPVIVLKLVFDCPFITIELNAFRFVFVFDVLLTFCDAMYSIFPDVVTSTLPSSDWKVASTLALNGKFEGV